MQTGPSIVGVLAQLHCHDCCGQLAEAWAELQPAAMNSAWRKL